ncbi:MAG: SpoIIE family protein phosphatase [Bacteroidales bacterium]|nr:SpoIIE family protein phosphatase [Bacteroidales bacterium]
MSTLDIILIILLLAAVSAAVYFASTRRRKAERAVADYGEDLKREIRFSSDEVLRYKSLYEKLKNSEKQADKLPTLTDGVMPDEVFMTAERIMLEQQKLELEKNEISERNRKLWDMSLLIEKEKEHIDAIKRDIEEKHRAVTDSITYAKRIQVAVLPESRLLSECFGDYFIFWRPKDIVSGDFYWMKRIGDIVAFTVADCTGHGVPGAFMSLLGITFLNDICMRLDEDTQPSDILELLRSDIIYAFGQEGVDERPNDGMDMALCILNLRTNKLRFAGANNPMYLFRNGELQEYKSVKNPIGNYAFFRDFSSVEIDVQTGDWIYLFSDGYADQFGGEENRKLNYKRFRALMTEMSLLNSEQQMIRLGKFLDEWRGNTPQLDDVMVAGYRVR